MDTLSLKDFVANTLIDLCEAVEVARQAHHYIAPAVFLDPNSKGKATEVNFDIAVTVTDNTSSESGKSAKGGGGLKIGVFRVEADIGAEKQSAEERGRSTVSHIQFSVPVYFQFDKEGREQAKADRARRTAEENRKIADYNARRDKEII
jgi:hypothetical protein